MLRPLARPFIFCEVGNGSVASFWLDNWTGLGPLIELTGDTGHRLTGLPLHAVVADAIRRGNWWLNNTRSRNPTIALIRSCLPGVESILSSECVDSYRWKIGDSDPSPSFSASLTWEYLHPPAQRVPWFKGVWFKDRIPKHAFGCWVVARNRMLTRDRLRSWGLQVPSLCLLCGISDESREHLYFDCPYSSEIWSSFTMAANVSCPPLFNNSIVWISNSSPNKNVRTIMKLLFQATIYFIWKERNARLHTQTSQPSRCVREEIQSMIKRNLDPMSRAQSNTPSTVSFLTT